MVDFDPDAFQNKSSSENRFVRRLSVVTPAQQLEIAEAIALCVVAP